ncbi:MAG: hypothetical protein AAGB46_03705 [Verrucomicrobiota bacterium]
MSGRICEVVTQTDWLLNMGGQIFDVPNFPEPQVQQFIQYAQNQFGYTTANAPFNIGNAFTGFVTIPVSLWVNQQTGRADMYNPIVGYMPGQQLLQPPPQVPPLGMTPSPFSQQSAAPGPQMPQNFNFSMNAHGQPEGNGAANMMNTFIKGLGEGIGGGIIDVAKQAIAGALDPQNGWQGGGGYHHSW